MIGVPHLPSLPTAPEEEICAKPQPRVNSGINKNFENEPETEKTQPRVFVDDGHESLQLTKQEDENSLSIRSIEKMNRNKVETTNIENATHEVNETNETNETNNTNEANGANETTNTNGVNDWNQTVKSTNSNPSNSSVEFPQAVESNVSSQFTNYQMNTYPQAVVISPPVSFTKSQASLSQNSFHKQFSSIFMYLSSIFRIF